MNNNYKRHGTTTLFAALNVLKARVPAYGLFETREDGNYADIIPGTPSHQIRCR